GLIPDATYSSSRCTLAPGERILLVTDGVTEAENSSGDQFGDNGFDAVAPLQDLDVIMGHVAAFQASSEAQDDWTLVDVRYEGT
ncbi:MAG: SpoIIE family protein phosphatase, partial [Acidobacteriaceae bacterium]